MASQQKQKVNKMGNKYEIKAIKQLLATTTAMAVHENFQTGVEFGMRCLGTRLACTARIYRD